jgi:SSS family solute:Na+ symporter
MNPIDWIFAGIPILVALAIGIYTQSYVKSVADFMSGGRKAERYLLAIAGGELQAGAVVFVAAFEVISHSGFTMTAWWSYLNVPVVVLVGITGFVLYRFRETRAMTLAQFFEIRYSKSFRLFTGVLGFLAGICNFGIIPAVGSRFLVYFLGLPPSVQVLSFTLPTYVPLMGLLLTATVLIATSGGIITVMVTNCIEGIMSQLFYLVIIGGLLMMFKWSQITQALLNQPPGQSLVNPFDCKNTADFNIWYVLMTIFTGVYGTMAWQNASAYKSAALTPHESRMGGLLGRWREMGKVVVVTLLAVCAITFLKHPDFAAQSQSAHAAIGHIQDANTQRQMGMPIAVAYMLPMGVKGLFCAILLMGVFGGDATHLHSWGGIFVQDILVPLRKQPFGPRQHIMALRLAIIGVALFAFLFGSLFRQIDYVVMWWNVTMAIYVGGAGSAIIGGLYWKKGTTAGAWAALLTGSSLAAGGILAQQFANHFPLNGMQVSFYATLSAISVYAIVSLLTYKQDFNLDRMLHRGQYATAESPSSQQSVPSQNKNARWQKLLGFDNCFTRADKWVAGILFGWGVFWFAVVALGALWNFIAPWPTSVWITYWHITGIGVPICISFITAIWFTWGGVRDIRSLFRHLQEERVCHSDDGTVFNHANLDEVMEPSERTKEPKVSH